MSASTKSESLYSKFASKFGIGDEQKLIRILKATAFKVKDGEVTDEQLHALLVVADEYGLNPFTRELYAYPDKQNGIVPVLSVDGWSRIVNQHPQMDGLEFIYDTNWISDMTGAKPCPASIICVIYRKDRKHPTQVREFLDEVFRPPFVGRRQGSNEPYTIDGPWQSHTKRMLRHKALIQCARIAFGFAGIYDEDEAQRIVESRAIVSEESLTPSANALNILPKLIARAEKEKSWKACLDYVGQTFTGIDLEYLKTEINKARGNAESKTIASATSAHSEGEGSTDSKIPNGNANGKSSPLAEARQALGQPQ